MRNESGLEPLGHAVLVEHYEPERTGGLIVMPAHIEDRNSMVEQRARIIALGKECWSGKQARALPGDLVLISKMSGYLAVGPADGKKYRLINDEDVFARITTDNGGSAA